MKFSCLFFFLLTNGLVFRVAAQNRQIDSYDLVWNTPSRDAGESMPCGGGDIGLNVWVENGDLLFYFSRSGTFDENNALLKGGRIRVRLSPNPFAGPLFTQKLVLEDGGILITGSTAPPQPTAGSTAPPNPITAYIRIWVDVYRPVIHLELNSNSPLDAEAFYESWRTTDRILTGKENNANSYKWAARQAPDGKVITRRDSIRFQQDGIVFYHRNRPGPTVFDVTVHQQGLDSVKSQLTDPLKDLTFGGLLQGTDMLPAGTTQGSYLGTDYTGWKLASHRPARSRHIDLYLATAQTPTIEDWTTTLMHTIEEAKAHEATARVATTTWWTKWWNRSFISIQPDSPLSSLWPIGRNYQLFRYMLACNAYGQYPTKFNGGLFTYDPCLTDTSMHFTPDFRNWGGGTMTAQNQRLVYFPMIRSGDFDWMKPQFEFYLRSLKAAEARTKVYWGHAGASFTEQLENFGLPDNAEYGWDMPAGHDKGVEYNAWLEYEWDTVLEFCLMMLETERYSGQDITGCLPFIQSCLEFFNEHYQYLARQRGRKILDEQGHMVLYPGSAGETYKMAYNSSSTIAGLHTILTRLLELPPQYLSDSARREWSTMLHRLPSLSFRSFDGHPTIAPAQLWERVNNKESMQLYPVFPWGIYGVGRPGLDTAVNTWKYDTDVVKFRSYIGWKQDNIFAARLGLTDEAARLTFQKLANSGRRFPAFWGPGFDWTPDHNWGGSGMIGLQEMLMQTDGKKIFLFPAWPRDVDVHFKLYAPYSTIIEATLKHGKVEQLIVQPEDRRKDIISAFPASPLPQAAALVNTTASPHATLASVNMGEVQWTRGFWAERFAVCRDSMIPHLWRIYHDPKISHAFTNFEIAAGLDTGSHAGPPFHDGDFYKLLEGVAAVYAITKDKHLDTLMDQAIAVIARCQRPDGYIHTPTLIEERQHPGQSTAFEDRLNFETYNMGHLMTAACVHYRATGKTTLLQVAIKAADYLAAFYNRSSPELARNAICPSHYMGIIELYRTTGNPVYLQLATNLIDIRGLVTNGTDDNQDRVPFRSQTTAMGHAVRANYLYAGVADLVAETGNDSLWHNLDQIWADVTNRKMYITGGCGALYDGVSPDAVSYSPPQIQEVHQAYGRDYQLPNTTAHNETCANIGNLLWNWRMLLVTGQARYADVLEQTLYNSVLSGVSLDGDRYFYTNPLRASRAFPYDLRWSGGRKEYIALSNCCPPNLARTMAEISDYMYSLSPKGLWVNLYGGNTLSTHLPDKSATQPGAPLRLTQQTDYPWDGRVTLTIQQASTTPFSIFLRIPGWSHGASLSVNGQSVPVGNGSTTAPSPTSPLTPGTYAEIHRTWKSGDIITLNLPMPAVLIQANPQVEETRGQVAVRRGPVVYCLESPDLDSTHSIFDISMPSNVQLTPIPMTIGNSHLMALEGTAKWLPTATADTGKLYHELSSTPAKNIPIRLIPYFAWANRGPSDMTVWMDLHD